MDAITLLKTDHRTVEQLFRRFEKAGDDAHQERREVMEQIIEDLSRHAAIEEMLFYPATRATVEDVEDDALESMEEHNLVKILLAELRVMDPEHERYIAKATVLMELVRHHVEEEEEDYFPTVRDALGRRALDDLGTAMEELKERAPTRPHPNLPDSPPANMLLAPAAAVIDRVSDVLSGSAQGAYAGLEDLVARIQGNAKPRRAPKGSPGAKRQARKVRRRIDEVGEDTVRSTKRVAKKAAKRTAKTARTASNATRTSAAQATKTAQRATKKAATAAGKATNTATKTATKKAAAKRASRTSAKISAKTPGKTSSSSGKTSAKNKASAKKATSR